MKIVAAMVVSILLIGLGVLTAYIEAEAPSRHESLGGAGQAKALVLYHPSRDAGFSDDLSMAFADGLKLAGLAVERATLTSATPASPKGYALVAVVSNTYWWTPDLPTLRYLDRARLDSIPVVALIGGAGATGRSQRVLEEALGRTGAKVLAARSFWLWRPNDEARMNETNRTVALDMARRLGLDIGATLAGPASRAPAAAMVRPG